LRGSLRYACKADLGTAQETQAVPSRRKSTSKSEEDFSKDRHRRRSAGDVGTVPMHEAVPVSRRLVLNRAFVSALGKCVPESNCMPLTAHAGEERLQQIQQEVDAAEEVREALVQEIGKLRQQQCQMKEKLKRCRDVVVHTVDCMDNFFHHKAGLEVEIATKGTMAEEEICADLLRNLQAAQARVVAAGVAATGVLATISDESDQEEDNCSDLLSRCEEESWSYGGTSNAKELDQPKFSQENLIQLQSSKKVLGGKAVRSPQRSPLCERNTIT